LFDMDRQTILRVKMESPNDAGCDLHFEFRRKSNDP
jgi:hypothetical protein